MDRIQRSELELERLGLVPTDVRDYVMERDGSCCRVCGRYVEHPALHHVEYRSEGGLDVPANLVVVGWVPGHDCHLSEVHMAHVESVWMCKRQNAAKSVDLIRSGATMGQWKAPTSLCRWS